MKLSDILKIDCNEMENKKKLVEMFYGIPYVGRRCEGRKLKDVGVQEIIDYKDEIFKRTQFTMTAIFYRSGKQTGVLVDLKDESRRNVISRSLKEFQMKCCVFCYYKRKFEKEKQK